ncbi:hypothetical protein [Pedobacter sp. UBA5917]|uniref:hypothetical protein n=1 Tax=Pedobacter sp. UBA5917 TaxID=1947061 RepID=UPI0025DBAB1C|nr:hypothetical protein [Pedobacter sp. UBA5917]
MASLYQRLLIVLILLIAFAGRIAVSAVALPKVAKETLKENNSKSEKPETEENDERAEEKIKLEDFISNGLIKIHFLSIAIVKNKLFSGDYRLVKCPLQTLKYPPKQA